MLVYLKEKNMKNEHIGDIILSSETIAEGVHNIATQINRDFNEAVIITVVPGGTLFTADLTRKLNFNICMDYISCPHTPGDRNNGCLLYTSPSPRD